MNLVTEHLTIRELRMEDLEQFDRLGNSDFVLQYLCMFKMDLEGSRNYLQQMIANQKDFAIASNPALGYNSQINKALSDFCDEMDCTFIDNTLLVEDSSMYEPDGEHVIMDYYPKWLTYMAETAGLI